MSEPKRTEPTRSLLQGFAYVPAASTDLRATFARVVAAQKQQQPKQLKRCK
jgi:hypothetical protein